MAPYEIVEHTADEGIRVTAAGLEPFFRDAAAGMFDIMCGGAVDGWDTQHHVSIQAADLEDLLVDWLSELLYLFEVKKFIFQDAVFDSLHDTALEAKVTGLSFRGRLAGSEIKAVTYHLLDIRRVSGVYEATVFFDL